MESLTRNHHLVLEARLRYIGALSTINFVCQGGHFNKMAYYLDANATTRVRPEVAELMLYYMTEEFGNAGSRTHDYGTRAADKDVLSIRISHSTRCVVCLVCCPTLAS